MLKAFGPALGFLIGGIQNIFGGAGAIAQALAKAPALSATLMIAGLAGKYLFPKVIQVGMIAQGVAMGQRMAGGQSMLQSIFGKGKGGTASKLVAGGGGKGGRFGTLARSGLGKTIGYTGLAMSGISAGANLMDDDKSNDWSAYGSIGGAVLGGILGSFAGPGGTLLGASLGSMAGQFAGGLAQNAFGKQHGGPMTGGNPHLVGETGPEIVMTKANSTVLSNAQSNRMFDTKNLETQLTALVAGQAAANKFASQHLDSVNRGNMIAHKTSLDVAKSARQDKNAVGMI